LEIFERKLSIYDKDNAKPLQVLEGKVKLNNVGFEYSPRKATLKEITFSGASGLMIAIVSESRSSKSTIFKLLTRLYDVNSGNIEINGQDTRDVTLER
jgi:ABC-type transport system involved in Fe-S cluster assembly fused permease/ATPase subunit